MVLVREKSVWKKPVLIVGLGGLGVPVLMGLSRSSIERVVLIDPDPVELSNLARQVIYREDQIGVPKVIAAARYAAEVAPALDLESRVERLTTSNAAELIGNASFVIDGVDDPRAKFLINDVCAELSVPFVYGGVLGTIGQAMTVLPGKTACLRCVFEGPPDDEDAASCRDAGILGPVAGAIGAAQADEASRYLRSAELQLAGRMLTYDARSGRARVAALSRRAGCLCNQMEENRRSAQIPA